MYIKKLIISSKEQIIRNITFHKGLNLIVDETPLTEDNILTGNDVGKTTVLKLIDFCLGGDSKKIYTDEEDKKKVYDVVKDFLIEKEILITLILKENIDFENSKEILIERNFLSRNKAIRRIDGRQILDEEFEEELKTVIFNISNNEKPTFRQIISHNFRYEDESIIKTLRTLDKYSTLEEYETLHLFLFGCNQEDGNEKQKIILKLKEERNFQKKLEKKQNKNQYKTALNIILSDIEELKSKKLNLNSNIDFEKDLNNLNEIKYQINKTSTILSNLKIRKDLIIEAKEEINASSFKKDLNQLHIIYQQANAYIPNLSKTFDELVIYHNNMLIEKMKFITDDLPELEYSIQNEKKKLNELLEQEKQYKNKVILKDSYEEIEQLVSELNEKHRLKGEYETIIDQLNDVETNINDYEKKLDEINDKIFSNEFEEKINKQLTKFNEYFSSISNVLYGQQYAVSFDKTLKNNKPIYVFNSFNANMSSGKKQGEISCFELAYLHFAQEENIPHFDFILNDKKELMHDNQLLKIAGYVKYKDIQFIASILKDKLPLELQDSQNYVIELSQESKLFRIEELRKE